MLTKVWTDEEAKQKAFTAEGPKNRDKMAAVFAIVTHVAVEGSLPSKLSAALDRYLTKQTGSPRYGLWNPRGNGISLDVTSLACFQHPSNPTYLREALSSHARPGSGYRWELGRSARKHPWAFIGSEEAALVKLATATELTAQEGRRLEMLKASKLGDTDAVPVERKAMVETYLANELRGDESYKGKVVEMNAEVSEIGKSPLGKPYLIFGGALGLHGSVHCQLNEAFVGEAVKVNPHDQVEVRGRVLGLVLKNVVIEDCEL